MSKTLLVSLVSDQTIPNVQMIKEFKELVTDYLFITTKGMESKGTRKWIEKASDVQGQYLIVNEYSFDDMNEKLLAFDFDPYEKVIVNLTGGTKVMTIVTESFFKNIGAEIFYVTGRNNEYIRVFPKKSKSVFSFEQKITLADYLTAYGFTFSQANPPLFSIEVAEHILDLYCSDENIDTHLKALRFINKKRSRGKGVKENEYSEVECFIDAVKFNPQKSGQLSDKEVKYLSGEWLEEYVGLKVKKELNLSDEEIFIGTEIYKEVDNEREKNKIQVLLGEDAHLKNTESKNEMDVMFVHNGKFYSIECKSSIIAYKTIINSEGKPEERPYNILGETIYKSDSLKGKFGLLPQTTILTLTDFQTYWENAEGQGVKNNRMYEMEGFINRANLSGIKLVDRKMIRDADSVFKLIEK